MASIIKKIKKGRPYYYAAESQRVDGKPRIVWQKYLGTVEAIVKRTEQSVPPDPKETVVFESGGVAALWSIAHRLGLLDLINQQLPKRKQGPSMGHYVLLAAINRALAPCSKQLIGDWYEETILRRLWRFPKKVFTSQRYWDHMDRIKEEDIRELEEKIIKRIDDFYRLDLSLLLYDTTNFFTYIATSNKRSTTAQRGHSKAKRKDLRQVGLALLMTDAFQIPLLHKVYPGNVPDVLLIPQLWKKMNERIQRVLGDISDLTWIMDRGNVSEEAMERLLLDGAQLVVGLPISHFPELLHFPVEEFDVVKGRSGEKVKRVEVELWGHRLHALVLYTESFFTQQLSSITNEMVKVQQKLHQLSLKIKKRGRGRKVTLASVKKRVDDILSAQFMKTVFEIEVKKEKTHFVLRYNVNRDALDNLMEFRLGRRILVTNRIDWKTEKIIDVSRRLSEVEELFKAMKNVNYLRWQPAHHWTDQKVMVHGFYCVLALRLSCLARRILVESRIKTTIPSMFRELNKIKEVAIIYPPGTPGVRKSKITLSRMTPRQKCMLQTLNALDILAVG